ncbi:hypothetical protein D3C78_1515270 [compost metagenome]
MPETNTGFGTCKGDAVAESPTLRHQRYRPFLEFRFTRNAAECGVDTRMDVGETEAVWPDNTHARRPGNHEHFLLTENPFRTALSKATAQNHRKRNLLLRTRFQHG